MAIFNIIHEWFGNLRTLIHGYLQQKEAIIMLSALERRQTYM